MPEESEHSKDIIRFMVGECPQMPSSPYRCNYFLRFSSKVSGQLTTPAKPYIVDVYQIAKNHFGSSVHFWHEMNETGDERQRGYYSWQEVRDARTVLRELEARRAKTSQNSSGEVPAETENTPSGPPVQEHGSESLVPQARR